MITQNEKDKIISIEISDFINDISDKIRRYAEEKRKEKRSQ